MKKIPPEEQETIILMEHNENKATIYSTEPNIIKKLKKLMNDDAENMSLKHEDAFSLSIYVPKSYIKISIKRKKNYSEETKAKLSERMREIRKRKGHTYDRV